MNQHKNRPILHWLEGTFLLSIIPLNGEILWWLFLLAIVLYYWRTKAINKGISSPRKLFKLAVVLTSILLFSFSISSFFSLQTFVSLLVLAACLKLMELESRRDYYIFVFLGCFVSASQLLFHNGLLSFSYSLLCFLSLHICLLKIDSSSLSVNRKIKKNNKSLLKSNDDIKDIKKVAVIFLQTLPIAIVLFIVMPRVGSLWKMPLNNEIAKTGVSDELSIGDIGRLNQDHSIAMRVTFKEGSKPNPSQLYWRGILLTYFDGKTWHRQQPKAIITSASLTSEKIASLVNYSETSPIDEIDYNIMLERTGRPWLYTLNTAMVNDADFKNDKKQWSDYSVTKATPVLKRYQYSVKSFLSYKDNSSLSNRDYKKYTRLPNSGNPQSRKLSAQLLVENSSPKAFVSALMKKFNQQFSYTLEPGTLSSLNAIDDFIFDTQLGYCEHFASSTVFILRAAGIPARIATGYQGGQWSENQEYLMVTQADAHAWTEVWYEGEGWVTLDPTSFVAPDRVNLGATSFLRQLNESSGLAARLNHSSFLQGWRTRMDNVNYQWHRWVLGYDNNTQISFVKQILGGLDPWRIGGFILLPFALLLIPFFLKGIIRKYKLQRLKNKDPMKRCLNNLDKKLAKLNVEREKGETISMFLDRVCQRYPEYKIVLSDISKQVAELLYRPSRNREVELGNLKRSVSNLKWIK